MAAFVSELVVFKEAREGAYAIPKAGKILGVVAVVCSFKKESTREDSAYSEPPHNLDPTPFPNTCALQPKLPNTLIGKFKTSITPKV